MNSNKQKMIIEFLLSSPDIFVRCSGIIKWSYFSPEYKGVVKFILAYYSKYKSLPSLDIINGEYGLTFDIKKVSRDIFEYACDEIEKFCKESAIADAIESSLEQISVGEYGEVTEKIKAAVLVSLEKDIGIDIYDNPRENFLNAIDMLEHIQTGIDKLDNALNGGLVRKQFTLVSANSGGGKSIFLTNAGVYFSDRGLNVLYMSLELDRNMIFVRGASIIAGTPVDTWKDHIEEATNKLEIKKSNGVGAYQIARLKNGSTSNDIRAYLKYYELKYNRSPDVIIIDYMDVMSPNAGISNLSISEQDKLKSEELYEIGIDYNAIMLSASQQNRDGLKTEKRSQSHIAGGLSKLNSVDNYISLYMSDEMRIDGVMQLHFLKARSSSATGTSISLNFNPINLQITDDGNNGYKQATLKMIKNMGREKIIIPQEVKDLPDKDQQHSKETIINSDYDLITLMTSI